MHDATVKATAGFTYVTECISVYLFGFALFFMVSHYTFQGLKSKGQVISRTSEGYGSPNLAGTWDSRRIHCTTDACSIKSVKNGTGSTLP